MTSDKSLSPNARQSLHCFIEIYYFKILSHNSNAISSSVEYILDFLFRST